MEKLRRPLPKGRTLEQIWNHYLVERDIAASLKRADRDGRRRIYRSMYDELFGKVPDHPRLNRREDPLETLQAIRDKRALLEPFLPECRSFLEIAPGDCRFAFDLCSDVERVFAIDISDQKGNFESIPENFELVLFDGFSPGLPSESIDVAFSDQLIEHIHPDDVVDHFRMVRRLLRPGGVYVFATPNRLTGPHDVSGFFCTEAEGFHLKEWTFRELPPVFKTAGFVEWRTIGKKNRSFESLQRLERGLSLLPRFMRLRLARRFDLHIRVAVFRK